MKTIEKIIQKYMHINPFSGQIMIAQADKIIEKFEYGYKDFESLTNFSEHQQFPIASITKQFTAAGILHLVEQKVLDLNQTIHKYLPQEHLLWHGNMPEWAKQITVHNLLTNSSGLPNYYLDAVINPQEWNSINQVAPKDLYSAIISKIKFTPLLFTPGSKFAYNDTNFLLIGIILAEFVQDNNLSKFYEQQFFNPLELKHIIWPNLDQELAYIYNIYANPRWPKRYIVNYQQVDEQPTLVTHHEVNVPSGAGYNMWSTAEDLLKWNYALHNGQVINPTLLQMMRTSHMTTNDNYYLGTISYGYGLMMENIDDRIIYYHPGYISGINTYLSYDPANKLGIAVLSNFSISDVNKESQVRHPGKILLGLIENIHREF